MGGKGTNMASAGNLKTRGGSGGFTLIELLTVAAIIALLAAVLLPVLNRAKDMAKRAACVAGLRAWGAGAKLYAGEFDGSYPGVTSYWEHYSFNVWLAKALPSWDPYWDKNTWPLAPAGHENDPAYPMAPDGRRRQQPPKPREPAPWISMHKAMMTFIPWKVMYCPAFDATQVNTTWTYDPGYPGYTQDFIPYYVTLGRGDNTAKDQPFATRYDNGCLWDTGSGSADPNTHANWSWFVTPGPAHIPHVQVGQASWLMAMDRGWAYWVWNQGWYDTSTPIADRPGDPYGPSSHFLRGGVGGVAEGKNALHADGSVKWYANQVEPIDPNKWLDGTIPRGFNPDIRGIAQSYHHQMQATITGYRR